MRNVKYRGLATAVHTLIANQPNKVWDAESVAQRLNGAFQDVPTKTVGSTLKYLTNEGHAERVAYGMYRATAAADQADPVAVIDQLLDAMAAAEPVLRKAKAVMGALREVQ